MSEYKSACEFLEKSDYEGGLADFVLGYGVSADQVPEEVAVAIDDLESAFDDLQKAIRVWHGDDCQPPADWLEEYGEFSCPGA